MLEINENWSKVDAVNYKKMVSFQSDIDRIQMHLLLVEKELLAKSISHLSEKQKMNRLNMLKVLHDYALSKIFPKNTGHSFRQPYFIDNFGTHCAVGFLVKESGFGQISKAISEKQNFAYVKEIVSPELVKWSRDFGFTLDELAWIQPGYPPSQTYSQVGGGTNGSVTCTRTGYNNSTGDLIFGGDFTELDGFPCLNVGYYSNNQLGCFGNGIAGKIIGVGQEITGEIFVGGEFLNNGVKYPIAKYDGTTWSYIDIPGVPNANANCFYSSNNGHTLVSISAPSILSGEEIWFYSQNTWTKKAAVEGKIFALDYGMSISYAGNFDQIELFENNIGTSMSAKNFVSFFQGSWVAGQTGVPDTIKSVYSFYNSLYLGGVSPSSSNDVVLSKYLNGIAQPLLLNSDFDTTFGNPEIKVIKHYPNSSLVLGGSFVAPQFGVGTFGQNLLIYDLMSSSYKVSSLLNEPVLTISWINYKLYLGGEFTKNFNSTVENKKHLVTMDGYAGITEENLDLQITLSPNPSQGNLNIANIKEEDIKTIEILDLQGKICHSAKTTNLNLTPLKAGTYFVRIETTTGSRSTKKWVKE